MPADADAPPKGHASVEEMRVLRQVSTQINATLDVDRIYEVVLRTMDELFGFRHSLVLLLDDDGEHLSVAASRGYDAPCAGAKVPVGVGVIGMVAKKRRLLRVTNLAQQRMYAAATRSRLVAAGRGHELADLPQLPGLHDAQSQIAIPMLIEDRLIGVFSVERPDMVPLDAHAEELVAVVANQSASAIHNARQFRELERLNATLELRVLERTRDLEEANAELRGAQAQLVHQGKMASIGQLASSVAHEINSPIASVVSSNDTLQRASERLTEALARHFPSDEPKEIERTLRAVVDSSRVIQEGTARVQEIVRRLRSFTRLDEAELKRADVNEGIVDTLALLAEDLGEHITVRTDLSPLSPIACYPAALNQVVLNLVRNAASAMNGKGTIGVRSWEEGGNVMIAVRDDGRGIEPGRIAALFEPRFTTREGRVRASMGLPISAQIVRDHQGRIDVESAPGKGSTFTVALPMDLERRLASPVTKA